MGVSAADGSGTSIQVTDPSSASTRFEDAGGQVGIGHGGEAVEAAVLDVLGEVEPLIVVVDGDRLVLEAAECGDELTLAGLCWVALPAPPRRRVAPRSNSSQESQVFHGVGLPAQFMRVPSRME